MGLDSKKASRAAVASSAGRQHGATCPPTPRGVQGVSSLVAMAEVLEPANHSQLVELPNAWNPTTPARRLGSGMMGNSAHGAGMGARHHLEQPPGSTRSGHVRRRGMGLFAEWSSRWKDWNGGYPSKAKNCKSADAQAYPWAMPWCFRWPVTSAPFNRLN